MNDHDADLVFYTPFNMIYHIQPNYPIVRLVFFIKITGKTCSKICVQKKTTN